jgi:hypothetical protein
LILIRFLYRSESEPEDEVMEDAADSDEEDDVFKVALYIYIYMYV